MNLPLGLLDEMQRVIRDEERSADAPNVDAGGGSPMAATDVIVRFIGDASRLQSSVAEVEGTGGKIKSWAKGVGAALGAAFVVDQLKDATNAAAELQDVTSASEAIFGRASSAVLSWAESNANAFLMSKGQAIDAANTFATFGKSAGLSGTDLSGFSTKLTGLAGDLSSFKGGTVEDAIGAIGSALRGESEPIRKYGVLLDDATLRSKALELGLISTTNQALTPQQKVLAANAAIWEQTKDAQGDAAKTADSAANQQKKLSANIKDVQASIGTALLPALQAVLPILSAVAKFIGDNADVLVPLAAAIAAVVAVQWAWNAAMAANPIGLIVIGIAALIAIIVLIIKHWDDVKAAAEACWNAILSAVTAVWNWIKDNWPLLLAILTGPFGIAVKLIIDNWESIKGFFSGLIDSIGNIVGRVIAIITAPFRTAIDTVKNIFGEITGTFSTAIDAVRGIWNTSRASGTVSRSRSPPSISRSWATSAE